MKILLAISLAILLSACSTTSIETEAAILNAKAAEKYCDDEKQKLESMTKETDVNGRVIQSSTVVDCGGIDE
jgi:uncharacterized protein YjaG (DUF416 family)